MHHSATPEVRILHRTKLLRQLCLESHIDTQEAVPEDLSMFSPTHSPPGYPVVIMHAASSTRSRHLQSVIGLLFVTLCTKFSGSRKKDNWGRFYKNVCVIKGMHLAWSQ